MLRVLITILVLGGSLAAQDTLKLDDGRLLRGEIASESEAETVFITRLGERIVVPAARIVRSRRGRGLSPRVEARLEGVDVADARALFGVALWASTEKSLVRDAQRLARRVLVLEPEHAEARRLLEHVKLLGVWYEDLESGRRAVRELMKERGFGEFENGFGPEEILVQVRTARAEWVIDEETLLWRSLAVVMAEKGYVRFGDRWFAPEEQDLIPDLVAAKEILGLELQAGRVGASSVIASFSRQGCEEHATELEKGRAWFIATFRPERRSALSQVAMRFWVLREEEHARAFIEKGGGRLHDATAEFAAFSAPLGAMSWGYLSNVTNQQRGTWKWGDVAQLGMALIDHEWTGRVDCPDWIGIAVAHHTEIAVYGDARTWWIAPSRYGQQEKTRTAEGRTFDGAKLEVREDVRKRRAPSLRALFLKKTNQMQVPDDNMGIVLLSYFLEKRKELFMTYLFGSVEVKIDRRFEEVFGHPFEEEEKLFHAWLGV
ncbi:MAG: hypothetical protein R3F20_16540 [Planctomycetota bacterium]